MMVGVDLTMDLALGDMRMRTLDQADAELVVEATRNEPAPALWGPRPVGPYSVDQATAALAAWSPGAGRVSYGLLGDDQLLAAFALMLDGPDRAELAYWVRPEQRRRGLATKGVLLVTGWAHHIGLTRMWLEIEPSNQASVGVAIRTGYRFEERLPRHCRSWVRDEPSEDEWHDCLIWSHTARATGAEG
jgi:RimJ/RimL family protein N-acetyltransferase